MTTPIEKEFDWEGNEERKLDTLLVIQKAYEPRLVEALAAAQMATAWPLMDLIEKLVGELAPPKRIVKHEPAKPDLDMPVRPREPDISVYDKPRRWSIGWATFFIILSLIAGAVVAWWLNKNEMLPEVSHFPPEVVEAKDFKNQEVDMNFDVRIR